MEQYFTGSSEFQMLFQIFLALVLGGVVGLERELRRKEAGLRTYALVSLGSAVFAISAMELFHLLLPLGGDIDPVRIMQAVAIGIGFIGAGTIIKREHDIEGLTTAAGLWVVAAIGVAVGFQLYLLAVGAALLALIVLAVLRWMERRWMGKELD